MNRPNQFKMMSQMIQSNKSINSIYVYVGIFWKTSISLTFFWKTSDFVDLLWDILNQFISFNHTSPSKSIDSVANFMKTN